MRLPEVGLLFCEIFFNFDRNFEGPFSNLFAILLGAGANGFSNVSLIMVVGFGALAILEMLVFGIFGKWGLEEDDEFEVFEEGEETEAKEDDEKEAKFEGLLVLRLSIL
ncbi:stage V sporulation protein AA, partial [Striga asiatica]